jgi:ribosomal protein S18 acetylase RimI-like enzyme
MEVRRTAVEVTQAGVDRVPVLAEVLASAFVAEPMEAWPHGVDNPRLVEQLAAEFRALDEVLAENGFIWEAGDALGVAAWVAPGGSEAWSRGVSATLEVVPAITDDGGRRHATLWEWVEERVPDEPLWVLDHIGVDPAYQGQGVGRRLIEHGLALVDADGVAAFLETGTARNVGYYERFGFRVVLEGDVPDGGPHIWFMRRDPGTAYSAPPKGRRFPGS